MKITDKNIINSRIFPCDAETMWKRWSTHEGLKTFFGRDNKIELRPGGLFEIYFLTDMPYGSRGSESCRILACVAGKMISFSWNAPPHLAYVRGHTYKTTVSVLFDKIEKSKTLVTISHYGWPDSSSENKQWDEAYDYFVTAWKQVLDSLEKSLSQ